MFGIRRGIKRLFEPDAPRDGLCGGEPALLELLDRPMLEREARAADVAAGRIGARDRPRRLLEAARVWRELARRTGDASALGRAAAAARASAQAAESARGSLLGEALCEQARIAVLAAEMFAGPERLKAANEAANRALPAPEARALAARLRAIEAAASEPAAHPRDAAAAFEPALRALSARGRSGAWAVAGLRCERAGVLIEAGARAGESAPLEDALEDLDRACKALDGAYHPISCARVHELEALALIGLGRIEGEAGPVLEGLDALALALDLIGPDHSPMDFARLEHARARAFMTLGEIEQNEDDFDRALAALGRALKALRRGSGLALRAAAAEDRINCLVLRAQARGDRLALDEAEAALRGELSVLRPSADPVGWAVIQLGLARLYLARVAWTGRDRGEGERAGAALAAALDVFTEEGRPDLAAAASERLAELRAAAARAP